MEPTYTRPPLLGKTQSGGFCAIRPESTGGRPVLVIKAAPSRPRPFQPQSINIGQQLRDKLSQSWGKPKGDTVKSATLGEPCVAGTEVPATLL